MNLIKRIVLREKYDSKTFNNFLIKKGISIGNNVKFVSPINTKIDLSRPCLIEFGNDITFSDNITILTHDFSWSVIARKKPGHIYPLYGHIKIGNNVFVGSHTIILPNVDIGDNVVIGASSVITKNIPSNCVVAGNPAKIICNIEDYETKISIKSKKCLQELIVNKNHRVLDFQENLILFKKINDIKKDNKIYYNSLKLSSLNEDLNAYDSLDSMIEINNYNLNEKDYDNKNH